VYIVDDDPSIRRFLRRLVSLSGLQSETFASAEEFLRGVRPGVSGCLLLDVRLPGLSGLDLQPVLAQAGFQMPIIFITGHGDIPMSVQAMKAGAVSFLTKPLRNQDLLDAIKEAVSLDQATRGRREEVASFRRLYELLTPRECQVLALVVAGQLNKQIAVELGVSERTVKAHRKKVMKKMEADSLADLVRMAERLGVTPQNVQHPA
jgi:FixJ family two-component response regulator